MKPFRILTTLSAVHKFRINILTSSTPLNSLIHSILGALQSDNIMQILFCFLPFHPTCVSFDYSSHTLHLHPQLHSPEASSSPFTPLPYRLHSLLVPSFVNSTKCRPVHLLKWILAFDYQSICVNVVGKNELERILRFSEIRWEELAHYKCIKFITFEIIFVIK